MGLTPEQHADQQRRLQPTIRDQAQAQPVTETEDATIGNEERLRGIPCVGRVSGTMRGTMPGPGASGAALEREARELNANGRRIVNRHVFKRPK